MIHIDVPLESYQQEDCRAREVCRLWRIHIYAKTTIASYKNSVYFTRDSKSILVLEANDVMITYSVTGKLAHSYIGSEQGAIKPMSVWM
jgi:hypothetical protein